MRFDEFFLVLGCEYGDRGIICDVVICFYYDIYFWDVVCCGICVVVIIFILVFLKRRN